MRKSVYNLYRLGILFFPYILGDSPVRYIYILAAYSANLPVTPCLYKSTFFAQIYELLLNQRNQEHEELFLLIRSMYSYNVSCISFGCSQFTVKFGKKYIT